jgi:hypothetical protein
MGMLVQWFVNEDSIDVANFVRVFREFVLKGMTGGRNEGPITEWLLRSQTEG